MVFDVNDFDEAYLGHWTWDVMRFCASLALLCWQKALPDEAINDLIKRYVSSYVTWVQHYVEAEDDTEWALTLDTAEDVLDSSSRTTEYARSVVGLTTVVDSYRRRFAELDGTRQLPTTKSIRSRPRSSATWPRSRTGRRGW